MELPSQLEIKESPIHGLGVFAKVPIKARKGLGVFTGDKYTLADFKAKYGNNIFYCFVARRANYIICAKETRNFITYINESKTPNVYFDKRVLRTLRPIDQGEELFLQYAENYPRDYVL